MLHREVTGSGPAVVLLHAGVVDSRIWAPVVPQLAERHTVVTYDQRGFGRSPAWDGASSPVDDLRTLLDELGLERVALVGLSRGGTIALEFTLEHPDRVGALVLVASGLRGGGLEIAIPPEVEARWEAAEQDADIAAMAELDLELWAPLGADAELRAMFHDNAEASNGANPETTPDWTPAARLGEVRTRTLVINADRDVPELVAMGQRVARELPNATSAMIEGADHMVPWRKPDELARLILDFLE